MDRKFLRSVNLILFDDEDLIDSKPNAGEMTTQQFEKNFHETVVDVTYLDHENFLSKMVNCSTLEDLINEVTLTILPVFQQLGITDASGVHFSVSVPRETTLCKNITKELMDWVLDQELSVFVHARFDPMGDETQQRYFYYSPTKKSFLPEEGLDLSQLSPVCREYLYHGANQDRVVDFSWDLPVLRHKVRDYFKTIPDEI